VTAARVVVSEYGETPAEAIERFVHVEPQSFPDVGARGPSDVIVEVRAAAVGWVDLLMTSGQYQHAVSPPYTPGLEYSGVVAWAGSEARFSVGDSVLADGLYTGPRSLGPYQQWGGFAHWAVAPDSALHRLPATLSFDQGCALIGNYATAFHCLVHRGRLRAGETVLVHGASGSTGMAAVEVAKRVGATVIATGRSMEKLEIVRAHGADHVLTVASPDGDGSVRRFREDVKALTGGEGVDVVYDGVGGEISAESLRCIRFGGRFVLVGWASTPFVAHGKGRRGAPNVNRLPTNLILMKSLDVLGAPAAISAHRDPSLHEARLAQIFAWAERGEISPRIGARYPLPQVHEAMQTKWRSTEVGTVVLHP
jgi:NADPH2:quinone reductase